MNYAIFVTNGNLEYSINRYLSCILYCILNNNYKFICLDDILLNDIDNLTENNTNNNILKQCFNYYHGVDYINNDYEFIKDSIVNIMYKVLINENNLGGFNTLGYIKKNIDINNLTSNNYINPSSNHGIYVKNIISIYDNNIELYLNNKYNAKNAIFYNSNLLNNDLYIKNKEKIIEYINNNNHYIYVNNEKYYIKDLINNNTMNLSKQSVDKENSFKNKNKIIVITLEEYGIRSTDLVNNLNYLKNMELEYEIYYGVNGKNIKIYDTEDEHIKLLYYKFQTSFYDDRIRLNKQKMTMGELGAAWSHMNLYNKLVKDNNYDNYIILEDDSLFNGSIDNFINILQHIPNNFDVLHIAKSEWYDFNRQKKVNEYFYEIEKRFFSCAGGYIISKQGANKLLSCTKNNINIPADDLLSNNFLFGQLNVYVPEKYIIYEKENNNDSLIKKLDKK
jgi:GR25 family glycosyltransferase involved in LPS biosynthesis